MGVQICALLLLMSQLKYWKTPKVKGGRSRSDATEI